MKRRQIAWLAGIIAITGVITAECVGAAEMHVTSSDATATLVPVELSKAVTIDLQEDVKDVLVADPAVVNAVVRTARRVILLGRFVGQSNVFLYAADGHEIGALDVWVSSYPPMNAAWRRQAVVVYRGGFGWSTLNCEFDQCFVAQRQESVASDSVIDLAAAAGAAAGAAAAGK
jgi:hypothetical protein